LVQPVRLKAVGMKVCNTFALDEFSMVFCFPPF